MNILLVVDMQNDFITGSLGTAEAVKILPYVAERIRSATEDLILFTQDTHGANYLQTQEGKHLPVAHCIRDTTGWEIHPDLLTAWEENPHTLHLPDHPYNALEKDTFGSKELITLLEQLAKEHSLTQLTILGLCTDICVISNALLVKAYFPELPIRVESAGCAGVTPDSHNTALDAMKSCQIEVL